MHDPLDVFQHDDRIVNDDTDRQHHAEQGQRVDRVAQQVEAGKSADQRHRHGDGGNQRRPPVLQEQEDHQEHEDHRLAQRLDHLTNRHLDKARGVIRHCIRESGRELQRQGLERVLDHASDFERIGAGLQENSNQGSVAAVVAADEVVVLRPEFDPRDVFQADRGAPRARAHDDVLEFLGIDQTPLGRDRVDQFLRSALSGIGRLSDLAGGELRVLLVDRARQIGGREFQLRQPVGPDPDAHRVVVRAENLDVGRARNALELIEHIQGDVVRGVQVVVTAVGREEREHQQETR